jgi:hypothetical protein
MRPTSGGSTLSSCRATSSGMVVSSGAATGDASASIEFEVAGAGRWLASGTGRDSRG